MHIASYVRIQPKQSRTCRVPPCPCPPLVLNSLTSMLLKNNTLKALYLDGDSIGEDRGHSDTLSHTQQYTADTGAAGEV